MSLDSPRLRLGVLGVVVVSLFAAMLARLWYLQVLAAPAYRVEAQQNSVRVIATEAPRGRILDRQGRPLADNRTSDAVVITREQAGRHPQTLERLAPVLGQPVEELRKRVDDPRYSPYTPVPLARDVPKERLLYIREREAEFPGVGVVRLSERVYPQGTTAAHLVGYVGGITKKELDARQGKGYKPGDTIGKAGVELSYEEELRGQPALDRVEVDSKGRVLRSLGRREAVPGHDVQLTVDLDLQRLAEESLDQGLKANQRGYDRENAKHFLAPAGSVVLLDPQDGAVLAMASQPTFNPNDFVNGIRTDVFQALQDPAGHFPLNNRVIQGLYAPGSTFKLVTSLAGLERGLVTPRTVINDNGFIRIGDRSFRNAFGRSYGPVDLVRAITVSSDVFFYTIGADFWVQRSRFGNAIQDAARRLGLGQPTGIELPYEAGGIVPDPELRKRRHAANPKAFPEGNWFTGDNVNLAIGQGEVAVTPLQLASAYATFANGGTVYAPRVGAAVLDHAGAKIRDLPPRMTRKVELAPGLREPIIRGMEGVVADPRGTAFGAFAGFPFDVLSVAGKTGTAQVTGQQDTALFCAFGPVYLPRYAISVVMEQSGVGGEAAAPVARRVFEGLADRPPKPVSLPPPGTGGD